MNKNDTANRLGRIMSAAVSRRNVLSGTYAAAVGVMSEIGRASVRAAPATVFTEGVSVETEWDRLRAVIVGRGDDAKFPLTPIATMEEVLETPQPNADVDPELERRLVDQLDGLATLLEAQGVLVFRPSPLSPAEKAYLGYLETGGGLIFMRDPLLAVGRQLIELAMRPRYRRKEIFALRPLLMDLFESGLADYSSMPTPAPEAERLFLEGGDVLLGGRDVLVGISGIASDFDGARWLQNTLGQDYRVHTVRLRPDILHLDLAIALLRPGLAIVDPAALIDGIPPALQGWDLILLEPSEAESQAANVLVIGPRAVVVEQGQFRLMGELADRGITPLPLPLFDVPIMMAGSFRCATHPLRRHA